MNLAFDDPLGWGFCKYCAFQVAVDVETGRMLVHERRDGGWATTRCYGSLLEPTPQPGPEARPMRWQDAVVDALSENSNPMPNVEVNGNVVMGTD